MGHIITSVDFCIISSLLVSVVLVPANKAIYLPIFTTENNSIYIFHVFTDNC